MFDFVIFPLSEKWSVLVNKCDIDLWSEAVNILDLLKRIDLEKELDWGNTSDWVNELVLKNPLDLVSWFVLINSCDFEK